MPTQWPLCTAIGNEGDGKHAIAIMAKHPSCTSAGGRSFHASGVSPSLPLLSQGK